MWERKLNGAIAYDLLSHVPKMKELPKHIVNKHINKVLDVDRKFSEEHPDSSPALAINKLAQSQATLEGKEIGRAHV